jgi:CHAT domain-containing protein
MCYASLLLLIHFTLLAICPAFGQNKSKVDTLAAFRALEAGVKLEKASKYDSAITAFQRAANGYREQALLLEAKSNAQAKSKAQSMSNQLFERHFYALARAGSVLNNWGKHDSTLRLLQPKLQELNSRLDSTQSIVHDIGLDLGIALTNTDQFSAAKPYFDKALRFFHNRYGQLHDKTALCYHLLGIHANLQDKHRVSIDYFNQSLDIRTQLYGANHERIASSYNSLALAYMQLGDFELALNYMNKTIAIDTVIQGEMHPYTALSYGNLSSVYQSMHQYENAYRYTQRSLKIYHSLFGEDHPNVAQTYISIGEILKKQDNSELAISYFGKAMSIYNRFSEQTLLHRLEVNTNLASAYYQLAEYPTAMNYIQNGLKMVDGSKTLPMEKKAYLFSLQSAILLKSGNIKQADSALRVATTLAAQSYGTQHPVYISYIFNAGSIAMEMGDTEKARHCFKQALEQYQKLFGPDDKHTNRCRIVLGGCDWRAGRYELAISTFDSVIRSCVPGYIEQRPTLTNVRNAKVLLDALSEKILAMNAMGTQQDSASLVATLQMADKLIDSLRTSYTYESEKLELAEKANRFYAMSIRASVQRQHNQQAFYYAEKNKATVLAQSLKESAALRWGNIPDSLTTLDKQLKNDINYAKEEIVKIESKCPACDSILLAKHFSSLYNKRVQQKLLFKHLEQHYPNYYQARYSNQTAQVPSIQQALGKGFPQTAILEYFIGDSILYAFCITNDQFTVHTQTFKTTLRADKSTSALRQELSKLTRALSNSQAALNPTSHVSQPASALYDYLIKPFEQQIKGKDLMIIPDGELNKIPFELLMKPHPNLNTVSKWQDLPYLIKHHNISYHYSATLLLEEWRKSQAQPTQSSGFLAFAPVFNDSATGQIVSNENATEQSYLTYVSRGDTVSRAFMNNGTQISPLPGTEREVKAIYALFNQKNQPAKYYLNDQANELTVKSINLKPYKYLHFATHGLTDEDRPTQSCLILAQNTTPLGEQNPNPSPSPNGEGSRTPNHDNLLTSSEMYGLELDAELVVLSACQTGKGKLRAGEGIIGLTRGLLYAGARNLLVSQWNVNDASTAELMTKFYSKILAGQSNRQALREAKLELLNSKFASPHYWSAFVLVGR